MNRWLRYALCSLFGAVFIWVAMLMSFPGFLNYTVMGSYYRTPYTDFRSTYVSALPFQQPTYPQMAMSTYNPAYISGLPMSTTVGMPVMSQGMILQAMPMNAMGGMPMVAPAVNMVGMQPIMPGAMTYGPLNAMGAIPVTLYMR